jgi:cytochrome c peroxidase
VQPVPHSGRAGGPPVTPGAFLPLLALLACDAGKDADTAYESRWFLPLPDWLPEPAVPEDNPATPEGFAYGRHLFYDRRLSGNGEQSCADCHAPALAFTDAKATPTGSTGDAIPRNGLALVNVAWNGTYTWPNPLLTTLEDQLLVPMFAEHPVELGMTGEMDTVRARLEAEPAYEELGTAAFPDDDPFADENLVRALATFVRGLVSSDSAYDRFQYGGESSAMSAEARRGMALFFAEKTECYHCHSGANLSVSFVSSETTTLPDAFFNTGLYNVDGAGAYPASNTGLYEFTHKPEDMGRFRTPTLRNVAKTAPYMHDGSITTLDEVIEHYDRGGRLVLEGANAGDGAANPYKSPLVRPMNLTDTEKAELRAFLESLTDDTFLMNPAYADPWAMADPDR